jgi:hypothetical protein
MKLLRLDAAVVPLVLLVGLSSGCAHKKPVLVMPQQQPATTAAQPTPTPEPAPAQTAEQTQQTPQPAPTPTETPKTADKSPSRNGRHTGIKKPSPSTPAGGERASNDVPRNTPKKVINETTERTPPAPAQISAGPTTADAAHSQISTEQLLQSAEANLNGITRQLSKDEDAMRTQIKEFINQSRKATTENDLARAHTLAVKARLLSDELVKQR